MTGLQWGPCRTLADLPAFWWSDRRHCWSSLHLCLNGHCINKHALACTRDLSGCMDSCTDTRCMVAKLRLAAIGCNYLRRSSVRSSHQFHHWAELHWMKRRQEERGWWELLWPPATCSVEPAAAVSRTACKPSMHQSRQDYRIVSGLLLTVGDLLHMNGPGCRACRLVRAASTEAALTALRP